MLMENTHAILYSRQGCHLCEQAHALLLAQGLQVELVDIDADRTLQDRYGRCVPVVTIDGKERFRGRIDPRLLRRLLVARRADAKE